jgi:predicted PurR-regulated permease PerM
VTPAPSLPPSLRYALTGAGLVVIAVGLRAAAPTVNLLLVSLLIAVTMSPIPYYLIRRGWRRGPAVATTVLGVLFGGLLLLSALAGSLAGMADKLPTYETALRDLVRGIGAALTERGIDIHSVLKIDPGAIVGVAGNVARAALGALGYGVVALILVALILFELPLRAPGEHPPGSLHHRLDDVAVSVRRFVGLNGLIGAGQALVNFLAMVVVGTDFAAVWGVVFFLLTFVPFGFTIGLVPPLVLTLLEHGVGRALALVVPLFIANFVADNLVKPKVLGEGLGISPLLIVVALMLSVLILGTMGAVLAIPLTIAIKKTLPILTQDAG